MPGEVVNVIPAATWAQWGMVILVMVFVYFGGKQALVLIKDALNAFKEYRLEKQQEIDSQREWKEKQGEKRDSLQQRLFKDNHEFQRELSIQNQKFIAGLQEEQKKSNEVLNQSIKLLTGKTDLILEKLGDHHKFTEQSIQEINKWRDGVGIRRIK